MTFDGISSTRPRRPASPSTSGTSTATAPTRPTRGTNPITTTHLREHRRLSPCACASPTSRACAARPTARSRSTTAAAAAIRRASWAPPASSATGAWATPSGTTRWSTPPAPTTRPPSAARRSAPPARSPATPTRAVSFDGTNDAATANLNLSGTSKVTVEFWMKWNGYANDDALAMEFTPNFNSTAGGFLIDPNAPAGRRASSRVAHRQRRRAQQRLLRTVRAPATWHHYAFVLDTHGRGRDADHPVRRRPSRSRTRRPPRAPAPATSPTRRSTSCRAAEARCSARRPRRGGDLQPRARRGDDRRPLRRQPAAADGLLHDSPDPPSIGQIVTFDGSASTSPNGTITKYEWDLDGNGTYETDTGTTPDRDARPTRPPARSTSSCASPTAPARRRRRPSTIVASSSPGTGSYPSRVRNTAGLTHYWRMGELAGTTLADSKGTLGRRRISGGPALGAAGRGRRRHRHLGALQRHDGAATANVDLSAASKLTHRVLAEVERVRQRRRPRDGVHARTSTPTPAASWSIRTHRAGGKFAVGHRRRRARATTSTSRGRARAQWHHYAFVIDTTAPGRRTRSSPTSTAKPVAYTKNRLGHRRRQLRQLAAVLHVARRQLAVRRRRPRRGRALQPRAVGVDDRRPLRRQRTVADGLLQRRRRTRPRPARPCQLRRLGLERSGRQRSPSTSGTSTATAPSRPTPAPRRPPRTTYTAAGTVNVRLRVTDNSGNTDTSTQSRHRRGAREPAPTRAACSPPPA